MHQTPQGVLLGFSVEAGGELVGVVVVPVLLLLEAAIVDLELLLLGVVVVTVVLAVEDKEMFPFNF